MPDDDAKLKSMPAHAGKWPRLPRLDAPEVVLQVGPDHCGLACGEMLLRDRGFDVSQHDLAEDVGTPATAGSLAASLEARSGLPWIGAALHVDGVGWELVDGLTGSFGSWAALLEPEGFRVVGHWVVVDGVTDEGAVEVRDPAVGAYCIPMADFARLWGYTVAIIQTRMPS